MENSRDVSGPVLSADAACTGVAILDGLKPATRYYYQILLDGRSQTLAPLPVNYRYEHPQEQGREYIVAITTAQNASHTRATGRTSSANPRPPLAVASSPYPNVETAVVTEVILLK